MRDLNIEEISQISGGTGSSCAPPPPPCCGCGSVKESKGKKSVTAQVFQRGQTTRRSSINLSG